MKENTSIHGTPWKVLLTFALPLMGANVLQQLYNTVDTLVVGNFDSQAALSAVGSCSYLVMFYLAIAMGFSLGAGLLVSQMFGAKQEQEMKRYVGAGVLLLFVIGLFITAFAFLTNSFWLRYVIQVPESIYHSAHLYITIYSIGIIFQFGYNIVASVLRAVGDSKSSLYFLLITSGLNIVLDLLFVCGLHAGVADVALATTLSQLVSMVVSFACQRKGSTVNEL